MERLFTLIQMQWSKAAFLKLWSMDHLWSSRSALVVSQKNTEEKVKFKRIVHHTITENLRLWKLHIAIAYNISPSIDIS